MKKTYIKLVGLMLMILSISLVSCKTTLVPQYTTTENLSKLNVGMDKEAVFNQLQLVYPHDILNGTGDCEIHEYLYLKPHRSLLNLTGILSREELKTGNPKYIEEAKATLVFRNQKLATVYTDGGPDEMASLLNSQNGIELECANEMIIPKGCTDPMSLSFDPDAREDDGSCEYCECGMVPNPEYNDKRPISDCNSRCIAIEGEEKEEKKCDECDLIDALKGSGSTININLSPGSKKKSTENGSSVNLSKSLKSSFFKKKKKKKIKSDLETSVNGVQIIKVY